MQRLRLFIAINIPDSVKGSISRFQEGLKNCGAHVKWVEERNFHLTLKFLGDTPASLLSKIEGALTETAANSCPLKLSLQGAGVFPGAENPKVVWLGISGDTVNLAKLHRKIEGKMHELGFPKESRKFSPHLTLGRIRGGDTVLLLDKLKRNMYFSVEEKITVSSIALYQSELHREGPVYTRLGNFELLGNS